MRILFWNTYRNTDINKILCDLIDENSVDIVVLAEYQSDYDELMETLLNKGIMMKKYMTSGSDKIKMFGKIKDVIPQSQEKTYSIQIIKKKYILCGIHLLSKLYGGNQGKRTISVSAFLNDLEELENRKDIKSTIIVGDMNENPYEECCLDARYFHGIPSSLDTLREDRTIQGEKFKMFYNPMWNLFGDFNEPPGSYYYSGNNTSNSMWHIFDQVMIRPSLIDDFNNESLCIICKTKNISLLDEKGHPNKKISDHLPIFFEIKE